MRPGLNVPWRSRGRRVFTMGAAVALVVGVSILSPLVSGASAAANGMLSFSVRANGEVFVTTVNRDGSGVAVQPAGRGGPVYSPDGNRELIRDEVGLLFVRDVGGGNERSLDAFGRIWGATWSADGARIAYQLVGSTSNFAGNEIWTMNADGSERVAVTNDGYAKTAMDMGATPTGPKIAYIGGRPGAAAECIGWRLWIMNPDGSSASCVTTVDQDLAYGAQAIDWSPDGTKIAMVSTKGTPVCLPNFGGCPLIGGVWIVDLAGGTPTNILPGTELGVVHALDVAWSPNGAELAIAGAVPTQSAPGSIFLSFASGLYILPSAGGTPLTLATSKDPIYTADWQPCVAGVTRSCISIARPTDGAPLPVTAPPVTTPKSCPLVTTADVLGKHPAGKQLPAFLNRGALCAAVWVPMVDKGFVPQGLALQGDVAWISGYDATTLPEPFKDDYEGFNGPCRVVRVNIRTGAMIGKVKFRLGERTKSSASSRRCAHGGGLHIDSAGRVWLATTDRLFLLDPARLWSVKWGDDAVIKSAPFDSRKAN